MKAREAREAIVSRARTTTTPEDGRDDEDDAVVVLDTPPRAVGESQGGTSITLAIRSPEAPPPARTGPRIWRLFSEEPIAPPASTAPPKLATEEDRGKRKRTHNMVYKESVEDGELDKSQHGKAGRP